MRTTSLCKNKRSEICFFRHFCIWGSPYANFLCAKCVQIPICESPYANKYCSNTPKINFLRTWDPRTHNEVVCIRELTYKCWYPNAQITNTGLGQRNTGTGTSSGTGCLTRKFTSSHLSYFVLVTLLCGIYCTLSLSSLAYCTVSVSPPVSSPFSHPPTPLQATSSHLRRTHTSLETPVASLVTHLADTMLRCRAPPLEAVDHMCCPLHCLPRPFFPSRRIVGCLLSSLVVLSTTRDCLACSLLFVSVDADRPRLAGD
jgi:hypothetical protein